MWLPDIECFVDIPYNKDCKLWVQIKYDHLDVMVIEKNDSKHGEKKHVLFMQSFRSIKKFNRWLNEMFNPEGTWRPRQPSPEELKKESEDISYSNYELLSDSIDHVADRVTYSINELSDKMLCLLSEIRDFRCDMVEKGEDSNDEG